MTLDDLIAMSADELDRAMKGGHPVDPDVLADREFDGVSLNLPTIVEKLTWTKFAKVFHRDGSALRGWNCRVVQSPITSPWVLETKGGEPITYGHYAVVPCDGYRMPRPYGAGLMLDYGRGGNNALDPAGRARDPIVAVHEGDSTLLLGWSYLDLGVTTVATPSFFALRRGVELSHVVAPPRRVTAAG